MDKTLPISDSDRKTISSLLTALATMHANKCLVEYIVIGPNNFEHCENGTWPNSRLDGTVASYFRFFRECCLPHDVEEEDVQFRNSIIFLDKFLKACEEKNETKILELGTKYFDNSVKHKIPAYINYATCIEKALEGLPVEESNKETVRELKTRFTQEEILATYRRSMADFELSTSFKYSTLEENIDAIIYATILQTERYLVAEGLDPSPLNSLWRNCGFFCDMWFSATFPDENEKSESVRDLFQRIFDTWPEYINNAVFILDYASIIQDRLYSNQRMNPETDWKKESFRIWNAYAAAALRLGEIFVKYKNHLPFVDKEIASLKARQDSERPLVFTEGKTDWKHIKNALRHFRGLGRFIELNIAFWENEEDMGGPALLQMCRDYAKTIQVRPTIFIADADDQNIIKQLGAPQGQSFRQWGNNVFSFCLPTPPHRQQYKNISIEFYYSDAEIGHIDEQTNRRVLFSNEVSEVVTKNKTRGTSKIKLHVCSPIAEDEYEKKIYDDKCDQITDATGKPVAHSKSVFADYVYNNRPGYDQFNLEPFSLIFDNIAKILQKPQNTYQS